MERSKWSDIFDCCVEGFSTKGFRLGGTCVSQQIVLGLKRECLLVNIGCQVSCNRAEKTTQFIERRSKGRSKALADHFAVCVRIWTSVPNRVLFSVQPEQSFLLICVSENNRSGTLISKPGKYLRRNYQIYNRQSTWRRTQILNKQWINWDGRQWRKTMQYPFKRNDATTCLSSVLLCAVCRVLM